VTHGATGHQFSYLRKGSAASQMSPAWLDSPSVRAALQSTRFLHASGISLAISSSACDTVYAAMQTVRAAGGKTSFDAKLATQALAPGASTRLHCPGGGAERYFFCPAWTMRCIYANARNPRPSSTGATSWVRPWWLLKLGADGALVSDGQQRQHNCSAPGEAG